MIVAVLADDGDTRRKFESRRDNPRAPACFCQLDKIGDRFDSTLSSPMPVIRAVLTYGSVQPDIAVNPARGPSETAGTGTALASWPQASRAQSTARRTHPPASTHRRAGSATSARFYVLILYMNDMAPRGVCPDECAGRCANDSPSSWASALRQQKSPRRRACAGKRAWGLGAELSAPGGQTRLAGFYSIAQRKNGRAEGRPSEARSDRALQFGTTRLR
jgi:hypothetical protein